MMGRKPNVPALNEFGPMGRIAAYGNYDDLESLSVLDSVSKVG